MQLVCLLQDTIWNKYLDMPLTEEEYAMVFEIDDALLYHEFVAQLIQERAKQNQTQKGDHVNSHGHFFTKIRECPRSASLPD